MSRGLVDYDILDRMAFTLENITKDFDEWIELGICPDCGGDLDINDECPGWSESTEDEEHTYHNLETYKNNL